MWRSYGDRARNRRATNTQLSQTREWTPSIHSPCVSGQEHATEARSVFATSGTVIVAATACLALIVSSCKDTADAPSIPSTNSVPAVPPVSSAPTADADGGDILPKPAKPPASSPATGGNDATTGKKPGPPAVPQPAPPADPVPEPAPPPVPEPDPPPVPEPDPPPAPEPGPPAPPVPNPGDALWSQGEPGPPGPKAPR